MQRLLARFVSASAVAVVSLAGVSAIQAQEVRPFAMDPNAVPAPPVPLAARFGYFPLYNPTYNQAYFTAWADAYAQAAASARPSFEDRRTRFYAPDYAAYYYTSRYYSPKYARYYWYPSMPGLTAGR